MTKKCWLFGSWFAGWAFLLSVQAQETTNVFLPLPPTKLDAFATNIGSVVVKATAEIGTVPADTALIVVQCKEMRDNNVGRREYGISVELVFEHQRRLIKLVDYDELDSLLSALDYLNKVDWSVTTLNSFDAGYNSKSGLRVAGFSSKRSGFIEFAIRDMATPTSPILISRAQLAQFKALVEQAKAKLDSIRPS